MAMELSCLAHGLKKVTLLDDWRRSAKPTLNRTLHAWKVSNANRSKIQLPDAPFTSGDFLQQIHT